jgi:hypothetical protein
MRKLTAGSVVLAMAALTLATPLIYAATATFEGTVSDSMCEKKHMMPNKSAAECTEECARAGSAYVLVAKDKVYTLTAKKGLLTPFAGKHAQVEGEVKNNAIVVSAIR